MSPRRFFVGRAVGFLVLLVLAGGGWYLYSLFGPKDGSELCAQVVTDARNPATDEIQTFPTPCDVPDGWDTLETDHEQFSRNDETWSRFRSDDLGIRFEYRVEPDGYTLVEQEASNFPHEDVVAYVSLFNTKEYAALLASSVPAEGPPTITVVVYNNPHHYTPREWVEQERFVSNVDLANVEAAEFQFNGAPAVRYSADGLYTNDIIVAENNGRIYYISGSYGVEDSPIRRDFLDMLQYFSLY